jgi:hypothetical protein
VLPQRTTRTIAALVAHAALALSTFAGSLAFAQDEAAIVALPSAESILDRYVEVTGGARAYAAIASSISRGTMELRAAGLTGQLENYARPGLVYTKIELPAVGTIESGVKDGIAWQNSAVTGPSIMMGTEGTVAILNASPNAPIHWRENYSAVETEGTEDVGGETAYRVRLQHGDALSLTNFYSVDSGLLLKTEVTLDTAAGRIPVQQRFEQYTQFGGVLWPSKTVVYQAGTQVILNITSGEINPDIPDERFDIPEAVQALLE